MARGSRLQDLPGSVDPLPGENRKTEGTGSEEDGRVERESEEANLMHEGGKRRGRLHTR
ncbi:hypothetical protein CC2G_009271 [Coprinopsis cinerea AmutBmut pab1-1]|nr:hypothetical protein CC2G_009271 [Coprinopsis cinerea AmutBmut pab1-1]